MTHHDCGVAWRPAKVTSSVRSRWIGAQCEAAGCAREAWRLCWRRSLVSSAARPCRPAAAMHGGIFYKRPLILIATFTRDPVFYIYPLFRIAILNCDPIFFKTTLNYLQINPRFGIGRAITAGCGGGGRRIRPHPPRALKP